MTDITIPPMGSSKDNMMVLGIHTVLAIVLCGGVGLVFQQEPATVVTAIAGSILLSTILYRLATHYQQMREQNITWFRFKGEGGTVTFGTSPKYLRLYTFEAIQKGYNKDSCDSSDDKPYWVVRVNPCYGNAYTCHFAEIWWALRAYGDYKRQMAQERVRPERGMVNL